jgi:hypothetical protein
MNPINTAPCSTCQCTACPGREATFNAMIPTWAASNTSAQSPIYVVGQPTSFDATAATGDTVDGVHPNASGNVKMANNWDTALVPFF